MRANLSFLVVLSSFQAVFSAHQHLKSKRSTLIDSISSNPSFTVDQFERYLDIYDLYKADTNWLEVSLDSGRVDMAFAAFKRGYKLSPFNREYHSNEHFQKALRELARIIETQRAVRRALVFEHGTKLVGDETLPKEIMNEIASYARVAVDVNSAIPAIYELEPPIAWPDTLLSITIFILFLILSS